MNTLGKDTVKFKLNQIGYGKEFVVIFYKVNGEQRKMRCMMEPPTGEPKNPNVVPVMDLDKGAWRSFKVDSVRSIVPISVAFLGEV
jgi:hypothetical protein